MKLNIFLISVLVFLSSCAGSKIAAPPMLFTMKDSPVIGETFSNQKISLGGFSGLHFMEEKNGSFFFQVVSDRGPIGWSKGLERPFILPEYSPAIITLKADPKTMELTFVSKIDLKKMDGKPLSGLPHNRTEENPVDVFGVLYSVDSMGVDSEGLTIDGESGFWIADEYSPALVNFDSNGVMKKRFTPGNELPKIYADKKSNRGFEAIAKIDQKIFGFLQSPLPGEEFVRIAEVDLETLKTSAEYFYPFNNGNTRIGDAIALTKNQIVVLEQNGEVGPKGQKDLFKITLGESDQIVKKVFITSLNETPLRDQEKIEGLSIINNKQIAFVFDNDFQIMGETDLKTGQTPLVNKPNQLIIMTLPKELKSY